jgi:hypothetical protein
MPFPKDTTSPFPLSKNSLNLIYKVCNIYVYINEGILGYVISLPLITRSMFKTYRMIPVPIPVGNKRFAYIHTEASYLCIDQTRQYYFEISEEIKDCKTIDSQGRICKQKHPLLSSHSHESCTVKLLQPGREIPKSCDTRVVQLKNMIWTQLGNNEWLYFAPTSESVMVLCNNKEPVDVILSGVGKFGLKAGCKGYSLVALLQTNVIINAKGIKRVYILSQASLDFDFLEELKFHFNTSGKLSILETSYLMKFVPSREAFTSSPPHRQSYKNTDKICLNTL